VRDRVFNPWVALAALFSAVMIQIGTNLANDLFDFKKGADTPTRLGPTRVTSAGLLTPREVEIGMWVVFGLAAASGLYVIYVGGWPMLVIGVASILAGVAYTAGPFPLGYNGLGDLAVFIFFGLVAVLGTYYAQARAVTLGAVLAAVPVGALATAILVVNNVRDADTDRAAGKRTLAVLLGRGAARAEYAVLLTLAYAAPLALWLLRGASVWALLPLLTLPVAVRLARVVITTEGPALNRALAGTAQLLALYGVLFALGIAL
jgi:1,4-dihydroxy-2-naphthoate octaprenyltransferase